MDIRSLSSELDKILSQIKTNLIKEYPSEKIRLEHFVLAVLETKGCDAHKALEKALLSSEIDRIKNEVINILKNYEYNTNASDSDDIKFDDTYDVCLKEANNISERIVISSSHMLVAIMRNDERINTLFKSSCITESQLLQSKSKNKNSSVIQIKNNFDSKLSDSENIPRIEKEFVVLNQLAEKGMVEHAICADDILDEIIIHLLKRDKNNIMLIGANSTGKTVVTRHLSNLIVENRVPERLKNKQLLDVDIVRTYSNTIGDPMMYANLLKNINYALTTDKYIFLIDDIASQLLYFDYRRILDLCTTNKEIPLICTSTEDDFDTFTKTTPSIAQRFHVINMKEYTKEECLEILSMSKTRYENYHNVHFDNEMLEMIYNKAKKHFKDRILPGVAFEIMDETGASINKERVKEDKLTKLEKKMDNITHKLRKYMSENNEEKVKEFEEKEIKVRSKINELTKDTKLSDKQYEITYNDLLKSMSLKAHTQMEDLTKTEIERLKGLEERLNECVVGQSDAVNKVSKAVKRQRVGLGEPSKPSVMMFIGYSGTGKTYLAKKLSEMVYGDKKSFVRLDMSEYSDKVSATKLYGTSPGYVGYEDGGVLTKALKGKNGCVLLLDEMEKANEEVFNVFLQVFDEGRLTDNKGRQVDFTNTIIIMTSNIGIREAIERGDGIGFVKDTELGEKIIRDRLKTKFNPEFLNRIDNIIMFNKLGEEDVNKVIELEVDKVIDKIQKAGYKCSETFKSKATGKVKDKVNYNDKNGVRPIIRIIQSEIEDVITDYIIDNNIQKGAVLDL